MFGQIRHTVIEIATAAGIFLAANGVYGLDLILGLYPANAQSSTGGTTFTVKVEEVADITVPGSIIVGFNSDVESRKSLCIDSSSGRHPHRLDVGPVDSPWHVKVRSQQEFLPVCDDSDNVLLDIVAYMDSEPSLQKKAQSDTITLFVRPE